MNNIHFSVEKYNILKKNVDSYRITKPIKEFFFKPSEN